MARTVRGSLTAELQQGGTGEPQTNNRFHQQQREADAAEGKVIADYKLNGDFKPVASDPENEPSAQEEEENYNA